MSERKSQLGRSFGHKLCGQFHIRDFLFKLQHVQTASTITTRECYSTREYLEHQLYIANLQLEADDKAVQLLAAAGKILRL